MNKHLLKILAVSAISAVIIILIIKFTRKDKKEGKEGFNGFEKCIQECKQDTEMYGSEQNFNQCIGLCSKGRY
jgi:hypothetical protein